MALLRSALGFALGRPLARAAPSAIFNSSTLLFLLCRARFEIGIMFANSSQILVLSQNTKRESGRKVQLDNVNAAKMIADVIRTCLGPRAMLKMLMDPMSGIVMTNDGNAILREITVQHPAAKSMIEMSRTQDEEVGDGTTSVVVLAGELLAAAEPFLQRQMHPTVIVAAFRQALEDAIVVLRSDDVSVPIDDDRHQVALAVRSCLGTKFLGTWSELACGMALDAVATVHQQGSPPDIKRFCRVEKIVGGAVSDSALVRGVVLQKDVTHPRMRRSIRNPRIVLLDCPLEYKKAESQTSVEMLGDADFTRMLQLEEDYVRRACDDVIRVRPDVVFTEKGVSDLAQHFLLKANVTAVRRLRKPDNDRLARACGATIVGRTDELKEDDVGTGAGLFEVRKIGDEYFLFVEECPAARACTIVLRGPSKEVLAEAERNVHDALHAARNVVLEPRLVPGGGATEFAVAQRLRARSATAGPLRSPYCAVADSLEVIPRTLASNCGANVVRTLTALRAKHALPGNAAWGVDGVSGEVSDMTQLGIWEPLAVKLQTYKTAVETAIQLLRIDNIVSGSKKKDQGHHQETIKPEPVPNAERNED